MERYDSNLYDYFRSCRSFDHKTRTIDVSELPHLCAEFKLNIHDCKDCIRIESQRISYSEITRYIHNYSYTQSVIGPQNPPNIHPIQPTISPIFRTSYSDINYTPEFSSEDPYMSPSRIHDIPVSPPEDHTHHTKDTPPTHWLVDHHISSNDDNSPVNGHMVTSSNEQWYNHQSNEDMPHPSSTTNTNAYNRHSSAAVTNRTSAGSVPPVNSYCMYCKGWQKQYSSAREKLMLVKHENDELRVILDKANKDLHNSSEYYQKHWQKRAKEYEGYLAASEREKHKLQSQIDKMSREYQKTFDQYQKALKDKQTKRLQEETTDSDGSRGHYKGGYHDDVKRDLEANLKQFKKLYSSAKQENDQLREQLRESEKERWALKDENQQLSCQVIKGDPLLKREGGFKTGTFGDFDNERPERENIQTPSGQKVSKSIKSAPSEASDIHINHHHTSLLNNDAPSGNSHMITVLNEDVCTSVLPETFTHEQQTQIVFALQNCHSIQELIRCLVSYGISAPQKSQEDFAETEYLRNRIKHLDAMYQRLNSSFNTAKYETEAMYHKLSQVEGNNIRLRHITKLCQQACEVHELLYEMKFSPSSPEHTFPSFSDSDYPSSLPNTDRSSGDLGKHVLMRARFLLNDLESNEELRPHIPPQPSDGKLSLSGWNLSMSQYTGTATCSGLSSGVSSMGEMELNNSEMDRLKMYYQGIVSYASHLVNTLVEVEGLKGLEVVKDPNIVKDSTIDNTKIQQGVADMEEYVDTEELCKTREEKAELRSQVYMMEQSKRSMELQVSRMQLQTNFLERQNYELQHLLKSEKDKRKRLRDKLKMYKAQAEGTTHFPDQSAELQLALEREREALQNKEELYQYLQKHIQDSQAMSEQLVEFVKELLSANRALVEAFERAKKRQQYEKRQLKQDIVQLTNKLHKN